MDHTQRGGTKETLVMFELVCDKYGEEADSYQELDGRVYGVVECPDCGVRARWPVEEDKVYL